MSNSVSRFTTDSYTSSDISSFYLYAYDGSHVAYIVFNNIASATKLRIYKRDLSSQTYSYDLTKEQIAHLLSLDCPDAFIAYALTLCPCPPETSDNTAKASVEVVLDEVGGGIPARHMLLSETVSGGLSVTGDFLLSDLDELLKDFFPVNGSSVPLNLE